MTVTEPTSMPRQPSAVMRKLSPRFHASTIVFDAKTERTPPGASDGAVSVDLNPPIGLACRAKAQSKRLARGRDAVRASRGQRSAHATAKENAGKASSVHAALATSAASPAPQPSSTLERRKDGEFLMKSEVACLGDEKRQWVMCSSQHGNPAPEFSGDAS